MMDKYELVIGFIFLAIVLYGIPVIMLSLGDKL